MAKFYDLPGNFFIIPSSVVSAEDPNVPAGSWWLWGSRQTIAGTGGRNVWQRVWVLMKPSASPLASSWRADEIASFGGTDPLDVGFYGSVARVVVGRPGTEYAGTRVTASGEVYRPYEAPPEVGPPAAPVIPTMGPQPMLPGVAPVGGYAGGMGLAGSGGNAALVAAVLNQAIDPTAVLATFNSVVDDIEAAASLGAFNAASAFAGFAYNGYAYMQWAAFTAKFNQCLADGSLTRQDVLSLMRTIAGGPAGQALVTAAYELHDGVATSATATVPATTAVGALWSAMVTAWKAYAVSIDGFVASFGSTTAGTSSPLFLALALGGTGTSGFGQDVLLEAAVLGPAHTTFATACDDAVELLDAANTYELTQTALNDFLPALSTYITALAQSRLFQALGVFRQRS